MSEQAPATEIQAAAEVAAATAAADAAAKAEKPAKPKGPKMVWVIAVNADMLNLFTNVWYSKDPKKVELDDFVAGQVAAGKLELVQP